MCGVCGCDGQEENHAHEEEHEHVLADGQVLRHRHGHDHGHDHGHHHHEDHHHEDHHQGQATLVRIEQDILAKNSAIAARNRARFARTRTLVVNLMSSPGSGKTTLLCRTLEALRGHRPVAVIEGDQSTSLDADRIRATGTAALQLNTGRGCHLDAAMVERALSELPPPTEGVLFIENVGNLVCPAGFDLGEARRVVVLSVTEGEDKPLKYPHMFASADLVLVNKADLLPHLRFDLQQLYANIARIRPGVPVLLVSATTGAGLEQWLGWLGPPSEPRAQA